MTNALAKIDPDNLAAIHAALQQHGLVEQPGEQNTFNRCKINGTTFEFDDDIIPSNQKTKEPAFHGRLASEPLEHQAFWMTEEHARILNRPNMADSYCKSYLHIPNQAREFAEDGTSCRQCPINPFTKRNTSPLGGNIKCSERSDVLFYRTDELGQATDDRLWILNLPWTSVVELKGMGNKEPQKGFISDYNFMFKLGALAVAVYDSLTPDQAVKRAGTMLKLGGVVAGFRVETAKSDDGSRTYPVVSLDPVNIIEIEQPVPNDPVLPTGTTPADDPNYDDLPF